MGFKPRRNWLPVCIFWQNKESLLGTDPARQSCDEEGWCICKGKPNAGLFNQATACGQSVTLPGRYEHRKPTCPECIELLKSKSIDPAKHPADLRDFLPRD